MTLQEAIEWLEGKRSMVNSIDTSDTNMFVVALAQADAAMMQQAYTVWLYHSLKDTQ